MRIIEDGRAPNPRRVRIFLAEKGVEIPFEQIDINAGDHVTPEFAALNPLRRVPVLILDDGGVITESIAICRYFEEAVPEPKLMGRNAREAAEIEMWQRRMELELLFPVAQHFRHLHPAMVQMEKPQVPAWGEVCGKRALEMLALVDRRLGETLYVAGDGYSVADITALVAVDFMKPSKLARPDGLHNLARWHSEVSARPSARA